METCLVSMFFILKDTENRKNVIFRKEEEFSNNIKLVIPVFSKTVLKKNFRKQEPFFFSFSDRQKNIWYIQLASLLSSRFY